MFGIVDRMSTPKDLRCIKLETWLFAFNALAGFFGVFVLGGIYLLDTFVMEPEIREANAPQLATNLAILTVVSLLALCYRLYVYMTTEWVWRKRGAGRKMVGHWPPRRIWAFAAHTLLVACAAAAWVSVYSSIN